MHLEGMDTDTGKGEIEISAYNAARQGKTAAITYNGTIEEDKELEAIFERTFGASRKKVKKVKQKEILAMRKKTPGIS